MPDTHNSSADRHSENLGNEFDLKRFMAIIIRRRLLIAAIAFPIILVVAIGTLKMSSNITAYTMILVEARQPENPSFYTRVFNDDLIMSTAAQIGMSIPVAQKAAVALEDSIPILREEDPLLVELPRGENLVARLMDGVDCSQIGESSVLTLTYSHPSARFALAAVEALTAGFMEYNIERLQNPSGVAYYTDQIRSVQAEVDSLMGIKSSVLDESGFVSFTSSAQSTIIHIRTMEQELFRARAARRGLEGRLAKLKDTIAANPDYIPSDTRFGVLKQILDTRISELSEISTKYKHDSVWVQRQVELVASTRGAIADERDGFIAEMEIELADAQARENTLQEAVATQMATLELYPQSLHRIESLDLQIASRRDLLENLQMKRGEVRLKSDSDQRISNLLQLNQPTIGNVVGASKKFLYIGVTLIFALALGLIVAIFVDNQDHRIYDRRQASRMLDVPVLGSLSSPSKK